VIVTPDREKLVLRWSMFLLFPVLIVSFALNQVRPMPVVMAIGQLASISATLIAIVVILTALPNSIWPAMLFAILLVLRGSRFAVVESTTLDVVYTVALAAVSSAAGGLIVVRQPGLLQRQFAIFCALSAPLMFLQIIGVEWTQILRTDVGLPELQHGMVRTLFAPAGEVVINTVQPRPAGFLHANNAASVVAALGLALHYGRLPASGRLSWADGAVLTAAVMLMAKLTFIVLLMLWLMRMAMGRDARRHVLASMGIVAGLLVVYRVLFPALFVHNLSYDAFLFDAQIRVAELLMVTGIPAFVQLAERFPGEVLRSLSQGAQSGYTTVLEHARTLLPALVVSLPYAWLGLKTLRRFDRNLKRQVLAVAIAAVLAPAITTFLGTAMFWFLAAAALLPLWQLADPAFCRPESH